MDSIFDDHPNQRVFEWLGSDILGRPYYLQALNLSWGREEQMKTALRRFIEVVHQLKSDPEYWSQLLRTRSWRHTLIGCVCVLVSRHDGYFEDLAFSFERGNWISPQIAVTMGIVYPDLSREYFRKYINSVTLEGHIKQLISAQCILKKLGVIIHKDFQLNSLWDIDDVNIATKIVEYHWSFWSNLSLDLNEP